MTRKLANALMIEPAKMVGGLWARRELIAQFTRRNIEMRHRGSRLGAFWALINPLSMLGLYFVVFGIIYNQRFDVLPGETGFDFLLAMFLGLTLFHAFSETLGWAPTVITSNPNFVKKVVFPLEVLPASQIGAAIFHMCVSLSLVLLGTMVSTVFGIGATRFSWHLLWLPVLVAPLLMLSLGTAWLLAALGVFLRDIGQVTAFLVTVMLFASAVMFPTSQIVEKSPQLWTVLRFNPVLQIIDLARHSALWEQPMRFDKLAYAYVCGALVCVVGAVFFSLLRKAFAEVI